MANEMSSVAMTVFHSGKEPLREARMSWIIEDITAKMKFAPGRSIRTNTFSIRETKWHLKFSPNRHKEENKLNKGIIGIFLFSENNKNVVADFEVKLGRSINNSIKSREFHPGGNKGYRIYHNFVNEEQLINQDRIEFFVKVTIDGEGNTCAQANLREESSELMRLTKLSEHFASLLWDEQTSDFRIICGEESFPCHRMVLQARSSFFRGLLNNNFVESDTGKVEIKEMASEIVKSVIEYIYTGKFKNLKLNASELLKAANRFDLPLLKKCCEDALISSLKLEDVVDLFILADEHDAVDLRMAAKKVILENKAAIVKQDGWHTKLGTLVIELFEAI